nr:hypothetical protein [Tanacetum cinerariifolium]
AEEVQEKHLDSIRKYQNLKKKPVSVAQARKNMIIYLKNMAGYKMKFFRRMTYDKLKKRVKKLEKKKRSKSSGRMHPNRGKIVAIDTDEGITLVDVETDEEVDAMDVESQERYTSPALTQKVFVNMRRVRKGFSGVETPLFASMLVQQQPQAEEGVEIPIAPAPPSTTSALLPPSF